jgi:hypothetical protein
MKDRQQKNTSGKILFTLGAALLGGCGGELAEAGPAEAGAVQPAFMSGQGEHLQSSALGDSWAVLPTGATDGNGVPYDTVAVEQGHLVAFRGAVKYTGSALAGTILRGMTNPASMVADVILYVGPVASNFVGGVAQPGELLYNITYRNVNQPNMPAKALCPSALNRAMPMAGFWNEDGRHLIAATGIFSFACQGGVVLKCSNWGYKPWKVVSGVSLFNYHQSCTRMARADYCSTGDSYTLDGTPIDLYDNLSINTQTPPAPGKPPFVVESIWRAGNAHTGTPELLCLSKKRWDTLPLGGPCPLKLKDPRLDRTVKYCDDVPFSQWVAQGAILGNDSLFIDSGLYRYTRPSPEDQYTTAKFIWRGVQPSPTGLPPGYSYGGFEGAVLNYDLGQAGLLPAGSLVPLYSYYSPSRGDRFTTIAGNPNTMPHPTWDDQPLDYTAQVIEGYVFAPVAPGSPPPHPRAVPLRSWYSPSRKEHLTSINPPAPPMNNDYVLVGEEGFSLLKQ